MRRELLPLSSVLVLASFVVGCGASSGLALPAPEPDVVPDAAVIPDATLPRPDTREPPFDTNFDTFMWPPDTFIEPDTFSPDTFVPDTFVGPDTFVLDTFVPDTALPPPDVPPDTPIAVLATKLMSLGDDHTCAVVSDGTVRCWGRNENGQLGDGSTSDRARPVMVGGVIGVEEIVAGGRHNCVRTATGAVQCWGWNERGQLGDDSFVDRTRAITIAGLSGVVQIAGGHWHTCVTIADGTARCWGENAKGQLGTAPGPKIPHPIVVPRISGITRLAAGCEHTCALLADHTVKCWGDDTFHQLGTGSIDAIHDAADVSLGCYETCVRSITGELRCFGRGSAPVSSGIKQAALSSNDTLVMVMGDGTVRDFDTTLGAGALSGLGKLDGVLEVAAGWQHACARRADNSIWCSGENTYGQLGDGTTKDRFGPSAEARPVLGL